MPYTIIHTEEGESFEAYVAVPGKTPAPAIIVIQEIFGVNEGIRAKCDWLAKEGFLAIAPDLFWRMEPNVQLTDKTDEDWKKAFDLMNRFDMEAGIKDLRTTEKFIRAHKDGNGKAGCLGYCLGGKIAYLMACRTGIDASVGYYGVGLDQLLDEANSIKNPLLLHMPEEDQFVSKDAQEKIKAGLEGNDLVSIYSYPGMDHAFTRVGGAHYDAMEAALADGRTITFFSHHLS